MIHLGSECCWGEIIVAHNIQGRADWGSLGMSLCWGCNAGVQGVSSRKLVYAILNLSRGFLIRDFPKHTMLNHLKVQTLITYTRTAVRSKNALLALVRRTAKVV
jgi:hypothetical protein